MITIENEDFDIKKIADSGQCFRLNQRDGYWINIAQNKVLKIKDSTLHCSRTDFKRFWSPYFDLESDYSAYRGQIPKSDEFLTKSADFGKGIRILKQDPWEMLITFIISQRKNIPAIKASVESLCEKYGETIDYADERLYAFPTVSRLAAATEDELKACSLGYRVSYIIDAARQVDSGRLDLNAIAAQSDEELFESLMSVKGVGIKVASCVALFAYHRIDSFPIDVWIGRVLDEYYKDGFPFERYSGFKGIMQQYMFYYIRNRH